MILLLKIYKLISKFLNLEGKIAYTHPYDEMPRLQPIRLPNLLNWKYQDSIDAWTWTN